MTKLLLRTEGLTNLLHPQPTGCRIRPLYMDSARTDLPYYRQLFDV
jgi:hypothetical protein